MRADSPNLMLPFKALLLMGPQWRKCFSTLMGGPCHPLPPCSREGPSIGGREGYRRGGFRRHHRPETSQSTTAQSSPRTSQHLTVQGLGAEGLQALNRFEYVLLRAYLGCESLGFVPVP